MIAVGTDAYYALAVKERFDVAVTVFMDLHAKPDADTRRLQALEQEIYALRVDCSLGPPGQPQLADPVWDITHNTFIRSSGLGGGLTLFGPSKSQMNDLLLVFDQDRIDGIPGRYHIVKTRRVGGSLTTGRWMGTRIARRPGQRGLVMAHDVPSAEEIFQEVYKTPWEHDPLRPEAKYANRRELFFDVIGSKIRVMPVVGGEGKGAGTGFQYITLSEFLRYEEYGVDIEDLFTNLMSTVPQRVETFVSLESSGRGDGGVAYEWVQESYRDPTNTIMGRAPERGWRNIFLPSYKRWDAELAIENPSERQELMQSLEPDEKHVVTVLKVPLEHIKWRRWYERTQVKASSPKRKRALMRQECPITYMDCFQSKGAMEFDAERIRELMLSDAVNAGPKWTGELSVMSGLYDAVKFRFVEKTPMPRFVEKEDGELFVWDKPIGDADTRQKGLLPHRYCMGVDIAEGGEEGNYSVAYLIDRDTKGLTAAYRGRAQHDELLRVVRLLSAWYNNAIICNEVNRFRKWTEDLASTDRRRYMYIRRDQRDSIDQDQADVYGWLTTPTSKDAIVEAWHQALSYVPQFCRWKIVLEELRTFRREKRDIISGKFLSKRKGVYDDTVMAGGMAWYCDRDMPKLGKDPMAPAVDPNDKRTPLAKQWAQFLLEQKALAAKANQPINRLKILRGQF